jgi:hypothetical protein
MAGTGDRTATAGTTDARSVRWVRVSDLGQARAALLAEPDVALITEEGLVAFAGVGFWRAVEEELGRSVVIDCGDDAGLVMAALRAGCRDLLFTGPEELAAKLADMAGQVGGTLRRRLNQTT